MYNQSYAAILAAIEQQQTDGKCIIQYNGRMYVVSETFYQMLALLRAGHSTEEAAAIAGAMYSVSKEELDKLVSEKLGSFFARLESSHTTKPRASYINLKRRILGASAVQYLAAKLNFLFSKSVLPFVMLLSVGMTVYYLFIDQHRVLSNGIDALHVVFVYLALIVILFFHELGHATASDRFGIRPGEIGFGFYFIFPVLFADVSKIWLLDKYKRIVVNFGGIYFQFICNIFLISAVLLMPEGQDYSLYRKMLDMVIFTNAFVAIYSLLPFLRNDGYWIYSDFFDIPNLMDKANQYPLTLWQQLKRRSNNAQTPFRFSLKETALALFAAGNYLFTFFVLFKFGQYLVGTVNKVAGKISTGELTSGNWYKFPGLIIAVLFNLVALYIIINSNRRRIQWLAEKIGNLFVIHPKKQSLTS